MLGAGGLLLADSGFQAGRAEALVPEIRMRGDEDGARVGFGPIRMLLRPGETVCWRYEANYHTNMANHQDHAKHPLHIPQGARPWASDVLLPGEHFEAPLTAQRVYDYFCAPYKHAGMIGRLIVG